MDFISSNGFFRISADVECNAEIKKLSDEKTKITYKWDLHGKEDGKILLEFDVPCIDFEFAWEPTCLMNRFLNRHFSSTGTGAVPVVVYCDSLGDSVYAVAVSEAVKKIDYHFFVVEETGMMNCKIALELKQFGRSTEFSYVIYIQDGRRPFADACANITDWWNELYPIEKRALPKEINEPVYSTWYSFHRDFTDNEIIEECRKAKELGMNMVIVDSGWQTDIRNRSDGFECGDWYRVSRKKISDMRRLTDAIHAMDMKCMLWFSVPFATRGTETYKRYSDKILWHIDSLNAGILDIRYPEIRRYLIESYVRAVGEWGFDGLKLDFIDQIKLGEKFEIKPEMDCVCIKEAAERLLESAMTELKRVRSDVVTELRQGYVGPNMQRYASIFRVVDCPLEYRQNRVGTVDLRLMSRSVAVHSDMLMWHRDETPQGAALQILNSIFSAIQFSVKIDTLTEQQYKMVKFWLDFSRKNKRLLLESKIIPEEPQSFYPIVRVGNDTEAIICVYQPNKVVRLTDKRRVTVINANKSEAVFAELPQDGEVTAAIYDCMGDLVRCEKLSVYGGIIKIAVPMCGLCILDFA